MEASDMELLKKLKEFQVSTRDVKCLRILLHGPIGAGKSSLINSLNNVLQNRNACVALVDTAAGKSYSFTTQFRYHSLKKDRPGTFYPFALADIMGLEPGQSKGAHTDDIISILHGHIKSGYTCNPASPIDKKHENYNHLPSLKDRVHCLVSVLPADNMSLISEEVIQKMKQVRVKARDLGIPQVVIMTMVDKACPLTKANLKKIYTSKKIKEKMQECSNRLGVPMNCIFPVKNYSEEVTNDMEMDILILMAATNIIMFANDYVEQEFYAK
ncbi:interferon-induced protein 44-like [Colossoma macropomum]|uniref:interferon-induced protein 44-like n=1 Tax=Colossoma macropomum TaxID=42526 RepID=UPI00186403C4|nr:interferon-induced protein 44-like [Colossoma macropomum]